MERIIVTIFGIIAIILFTLSLIQLYEKGILIHKAYFSLSKEERENLNKKPYFRQSGTIFAFLGMISLLTSFNIELKTTGLLIAIIILILLTILYVILSTKKINKN